MGQSETIKTRAGPAAGDTRPWCSRRQQILHRVAGAEPMERSRSAPISPQDPLMRLMHDHPEPVEPAAP